MKYIVKINDEITSREVQSDKWKKQLNTDKQSQVSISWIGHMEASPTQFYCNFKPRTEFCIQYTIKGKGYFFTNNHLHHIEKGTLWLIPKEQYYYYTSDKNDPYEYYWFHFSGLGAQEFLDKIGLNEETPVISGVNDPNIKIAFDKLITTTKEGETNAHLILSLVHNLMYEIETTCIVSNNKHKGTSNDSIDKVITYIKNHYFEDISLQHMADVAILEKSYFIKKFKKHTNLTPTQFLINYRISQVCALLHTSMPLTSIAYQCGFRDITNFLMRFKQATGTTPTQYRKNLSNKSPQINEMQPKS